MRSTLPSILAWRRMFSAKFPFERLTVEIIRSPRWAGSLVVPSFPHTRHFSPRFKSIGVYRLFLKSKNRTDLSGWPLLSGHLALDRYSSIPMISLIVSWASIDETSEIVVEKDGTASCSNGASHGFRKPTIYEYWLGGNMHTGQASLGGRYTWILPFIPVIPPSTNGTEYFLQIWVRKIRETTLSRPHTITFESK